MKKILLLSLLFVGLSQASPVDKIVLSFNTKGKLVKNQCLPYAKAIHGELEALGVEAYLVTYYWQNKHQYGRHAVVVYRHNGGYWIVDNELERPKIAVGDNPKDWINYYHPHAVNRVEYVVNRKYFVGN